MLPRFVLILAPFLLLTSCRNRVDWNFPHYQPFITINGVVKAGEPITVHVSLAGSIDTSMLRPATNAVVKILKDGVYLETLKHMNNGLYTSISEAEMGIYTCVVEIPGYGVVSASTAVPEPMPIISLYHIDDAGPDTWGTTHPALGVTFGNNPEAIIYMDACIKYFQNSSSYRIQLINTIDPVLLNEGIPLTLFSNEIIDNKSYSMIINYTTGSKSSTGDGVKTDLYPLVLELRTVSYDYYQYSRQLYLYDSGRFPEIVGGTVTVFPLYSNVEGGHGVFAGYSSVVSDTIYPSGISEIK